MFGEVWTVRVPVVDNPASSNGPHDAKEKVDFRYIRILISGAVIILMVPFAGQSRAIDPLERVELDQASGFRSSDDIFN